MTLDNVRHACDDILGFVGRDMPKSIPPSMRHDVQDWKLHPPLLLRMRGEQKILRRLLRSLLSPLPLDASSSSNSNDSIGCASAMLMTLIVPLVSCGKTGELATEESERPEGA